MFCLCGFKIHIVVERISVISSYSAIKLKISSLTSSVSGTGLVIYKQVLFYNNLDLYAFLVKLKLN